MLFPVLPHLLLPKENCVAQGMARLWEWAFFVLFACGSFRLGFWICAITENELVTVHLRVCWTLYDECDKKKNDCLYPRTFPSWGIRGWRLEKPSFPAGDRGDEES